MQARAVFLFLSCSISLTLAQAPPAQLHIYHFDVGNGDATLVVTPTKHTLLIDGGRRGDGRAKVIPQLGALDIKTLDYIVATHFDPDHTGGLQEVWETISMSGDGAAYDRQRAWPNFVGGQNKKPPPLMPDSMLEFKQDPNLKVICVAVNGKVSGGIGAKGLAENDENSRSIALTIEYGKFRYFIGGDLTGEVESLVAGNTGKVTVLRVNHHGSQTSSTQKFLDALAPKVAIISVGTGGMNKEYHFPSGAALNRLLALKGLEKIYMTTSGETKDGPASKDKIEVVNGDIEIATDGQESFKVNSKEFKFDEKK
jgi:competence protein ComEC